MAEAAKYLVLEKSYLGHNLVEAGQEVDYDGVPGPNLEPLNDAAKEAKEGAPRIVAQAEQDLARAQAPVTVNLATDNEAEIQRRIDEALAKQGESHATDNEAEIQRRIDEALAKQGESHAAEILKLKAEADEPKKTGSKDPEVAEAAGKGKGKTDDSDLA